MQTVLESLDRNKVNYHIFDDIWFPCAWYTSHLIHFSIEPTDESVMEASEFARAHDFDHILAVGGGSVMVW